VGKMKLIAGPCVIESEGHVRLMAAELKAIIRNFDVDYYFKASFDKANRTSLDSFRGPGFHDGINILSRVQEDFDLRVTTDFHDTTQIRLGGFMVDVIQIPAFLCRQTDLLVAAGQTGKIVNIKKGQFATDTTIRLAQNKVGLGSEIWLTERGTSFGDQVVIDFHQFKNRPMIADVTHTAKRRAYVPTLAKAAIAAGAVGIFMEVHNNPDAAKCDGNKSVELADFEGILTELTQLWEFVHREKT